MEQVLQNYRERILSAGETSQPLRWRGGGSKDWYGQSLQGEIVDTREWRGITDYEPTELVVTARCGTPLAELEATLAAQGQMLAFEPPHFGPDATVGGMVACGLSGPRRQAVGAVRDFVLGAVLMDGRGEVLHFGGKVMKNVAGYDVSRALAGSLGTLGLILEVSLKVLPLPYAESTLSLAMSEAEALQALNAWGGQPLPISASVWQAGSLLVRLSGAMAAVSAAIARIGGATIENGPAMWAALREQQVAFFLDAAQEGRSLWRLSVPSATPPLALSGEQLIEWGGAQRWLKTDAPAAQIRATVTQVGGHATVFSSADAGVDVFHPLAPAFERIQRRLMASFDPAGVFNRGRMYRN